MSVLIQAQYECFKKDNLSNVRTLFTPNDVRVVADRTGWQIVAEKSIDSSDLQDGIWEIEQTLSNYQAELKLLDNLPLKLSILIESEISLLEAAIEKYRD